jgi:predicted kinase
MLTGLPGSGKTTIARAYTERYGGVHLSSDIVRAALGLRGRYSPEAKQRVYDELLAQARRVLQSGQDAIVDSVLHREALRRPFRRLAEECGATCRWVQLRVSEDSVRTRLAKPRPDSEANPSVYENLRNQWEEIEGEHLTLTADVLSTEALVGAIREYAQSP